MSADSLTAICLVIVVVVAIKSLSYLVPNMKQILKDFRLKETLATSEKIKPILNGLLFGRYISCQAERADYTLDLPNNDSTRYY